MCGVCVCVCVCVYIYIYIYIYIERERERERERETAALNSTRLKGSVNYALIRSVSAALTPEYSGPDGEYPEPLQQNRRRVERRALPPL